VGGLSVLIVRSPEKLVGGEQSMLELSLFSNLSTRDLVFPSGTATAKGVNNIVRKLSLGQVD
jgi:hypothetical protein